MEVGACAGDGSRAISGYGTTTDTASGSDTTTTGTSSVVIPTTTTTRALSSDSVSMTNDNLICAAENDACTAESSCLACPGAILSSQEACQGLDFDSDTATCDEKQQANCCALVGGTDCENNALLGALYGGWRSLDLVRLREWEADVHRKSLGGGKLYAGWNVQHTESVGRVCSCCRAGLHRSCHTVG